MTMDDATAAWIRANAYELAMAAVAAYELAPEGSGVDLSLGAAGDAMVAMLDGERDPEAAVRKVLGAQVRDASHWLFRWQARHRLLATERDTPC
jgi:hypothetical protein